jgi:tetratricopeptide (TPR) repeat protein
MMSQRTPSAMVGVDWTEATARRRATADRFELRMPIGVGGFGEVWRALDTTTQETVAIKVLQRDLAHEPASRSLLLDECRMVGRLMHPSVVRLVDVGTLGPQVERATGGRCVAGSPYVAMELLDGGSLASLVRSPAGWEPVRRALREILEALRHAHARGVVHLDLKPANVLFRERDGRAVVCDFGIAWSRHDEREPRFAGTLAYASPEQLVCDARAVGPWSDLFALGCVAWELVAGAPPFSGRTVAERMFQKPCDFVPRFEVPEGLEAWLHRALAASPRQRFRSAAEALGALCPESVSHGVPEGWRDGEPHVSPELVPPTLTRVPEFLGVAPTGMIGRDAERSELWRRAREVVDRGLPHHVELVGPAGAGKRRLATWLSERLAELDAFETVWVREDESIGDALVRHLRIEGVAPRRARESLSWAGEALAAAVSEAVVESAGGVEIGAPPWTALLEAMAARSPILLVLEEHVAPSGLRGPLVTLRLTRRAQHAPEGATTIPLDELSEAEAVELARAAGAKAPERVAAATPRLPGWILDRHAEASARSEAAASPDRIGRLGAQICEPEVRALEVLGFVEGPIATRVWERIARAVGAAPTWQAIDALVRLGLGQLEAGRISVPCPRIRDAFARRARSRARAIHLASASTFASADDVGGHLALAANHWIAAGEVARALDPLGRAAEKALRRLDLVEAASLATTHSAACDELGLADHDPRRFTPTIVLAEHAHHSGSLEDVERWVARGLVMADRAERPDLRARVLHVHARALHRAGRRDEAIETAREAERTLGMQTSSARRDLLVAVRLDLGAWLLELERSDEAEHLFCAVLETRPSPHARCIAELLRARVDRHRARWDDATKHVEAAIEILTRAGRQHLLSEAMHEAGEIARARGAWEDAARWLTRALEGFVSLGRDAAVDAELALGLVLVELGRHDDAMTHLEGACSGLSARGELERARAWQVGKAWAAAASGDWASAEMALAGAGASDEPDWELIRAKLERLASERGRTLRCEALQPTVRVASPETARALDASAGSTTVSDESRGPGLSPD